MIKTRINNEHKDIVGVFGSGTLQKEIIKIWSREAGTYVYESSVEYTGALPITINANGEALIDYRIYGASGGVGEPTESGEPVGYKLPMTVQSANLFDKSSPDIIMGKGFYSRTFSVLFYNNRFLSGYIKVKPSTTYICNSQFSVRIYTSDDGENSSRSRVVDSGVFKTNGDENFIMLDEYQTNINELLLQELLETPIYIGENKLDKGEYVSYSEQKIYRNVGEDVDPVNLFNKDSEDIMSGYEIIGSGIRANSAWMISERIPVISGYKYIKEIFGNAILQYVSYDDENPTWASFSANAYTAPNNIRYVRINCTIANKEIAKFYRNLSPTDPPVPLPAIPTVDGTTVIDCDLTDKPSEMYVKYRR